MWARFYIGRNWDGMVAFKEDHQLVRTGPYSIVRHPIYSGFMLATLGTAIVQGEAWRLSSVALIVTAWGYKARVEETFLMQRFGPEYEAIQAPCEGAGSGGLVKVIFRLNPSSGIPLYLQLMEQVKHAVETGALRKAINSRPSAKSPRIW